MRQPVGFIGLGHMGVPTVQNLLQAGHTLSVFNRTASRAYSLGDQGATRAASPRALAERNDMVRSMGADDTGLKVMALRADGVWLGLLQARSVMI